MPLDPFTAPIDRLEALDDDGVVAAGAAELVLVLELLLPPHAATSSATPSIAATVLTRYLVISSTFS
jgi:hypothetical protein